MDLKGAQLRNFFGITDDIGSAKSETPSTIRIPHYQRPFTWKKDNINKLITDWNEIDYDKSSDREYFAGSIVTVKEGEDIAQQLIDGQQRFTTMYLATYIAFLLARSILKHSAQIKRSGTFNEALRYYKKSAIFLFESDNINIHFQELEKLVRPLERNDDKNAKSAYNQVLSLLSFPEQLLEEDTTYKNKHKDLLVNNDLFNSLRLTYDRTSYNKSLVSALQHIGINISTHSRPYLFISETNIQTSVLDYEKYIEALEEIFNSFNKINYHKLKHDSDLMSDSLDYSLKLLINIHLFLNKVSFCVVQTGDVKDAYLLFEVLNDRSLALDDLDLIKNQFYKNFVTKNKEINDDKIDETIQEIDTQWVNEIFSERTPVSLKKLVAYFGITFITGDTTLKYTDGRTYRDSIQKYLEGKDSYSAEDIKIHFRIFQACRTILSDILNIPFQKTESYALLNEYKQNVSSFVKVVLYLHAKKQYGVLSGLMNFTLRYYQDSIKDLTLDINQLKGILNELVKNCPLQIREQSFELWKTSMLAKSEIEPRDLAIKIIKRNKLDSELNDMQRPDNLQDLDAQFDDWLSSWSYNKDDFKVRILFAKFFSLGIDENNTLVRRPAQLSLDEDNIKSLQLDHLEPQKISPSNPKAYFTHNNREAYINSLGNLIPLTAELNRQKSNKPLSEGLKYFIDFGIEHHPLYKNITDMLPEQMIPDEDFFINRTKWLKSIFKDLVYFPPNK